MSGEQRDGVYWPPDTLPQEAVDAFTEVWEAERNKIGYNVAEPGTKTRAGLSAALQVLYEKCVID